MYKVHHATVVERGEGGCLTFKGIIYPDSIIIAYLDKYSINKCYELNVRNMSY